MRALDRLRRSGVAVGPDRTIAHVARVMERSGVGVVAVVDDDRLVGVVTDRDLVRRGLARGLPDDARVDAVMSSPVVTVEADAELADAIEVFRRHAVRRVAVVDAERFVGIISLDDLLTDASEQLRALTGPLASEVVAPQRDSPVPATR